MDEDDWVYASILARVERPELDKQLHTVLRKECRSIGRQVDRASSSLAAARQLQAAAEFLRPSGDWQPKRLKTQLKSIEQMQSRLETALNELEKRTKKKKRRKRKRPAEAAAAAEEEDALERTEKEKLRDREIIVLDDDEEEEEDDLVIVEGEKARANAEQEQEEESGVEFLQVVTPADMKTGEAERVESDRTVTVEKCSTPVDVIDEEEDDCEVEIFEMDSERIQEGCGGVERVENEGAVLDSSGRAETNEEGGALPNGLVRRSCNEAVRVKEEVVMLSDQQTVAEVLQQEVCDSAMELEVPESSEESAVELEASDSDQLAMELEVLDSESDDDDFSPCRELVDKLQNESDATHQLVMFPQTVAGLRSYLLDCKHLEVDEYLYAHKSFTHGELKELGCAIETIASVGMDLPRRPRVKMALNDLLTLVEQLEHTLGELPPYLDPIVERLFSYFSLPVKKKTPERAR